MPGPPPPPSPASSRPLVVWALEAEPGRKTPPYVLISRKLVFLQAALMFLITLLLAWGGYFLGSRRGAPALELESGEILLSGTVLYWDDKQQVMPDQGAVVLLLPADRRPDSPLSARVFQPGQRPKPNDPNLLKLEEWNGAVARVDAAGNYRLAIPGPGKYWVLVVSHRARRPREQAVPREVMQRLQTWFTPAGVLIGRSKYLFQQVEIPPDADGPVHLNHFFGKDAGK